jgi:uncharacterized FlgJ-related protein
MQNECLSNEFEETAFKSVQESAGQEILNYSKNKKFESIRYSPVQWQKSDIKSKDNIKKFLTVENNPYGITANFPF